MKLYLAIFVLWILASLGLAGEDRAGENHQIVVSEREAFLEHGPCQDCHNAKFSHKTRQPNVHSEIKIDHFKAAKSCSVCHDPARAQALKLLTGASISWNDSNQLCGFCHGQKYRDWQFGAHGKSVGSWLRTQIRLSCADCHDPHDPKPRAVQAISKPKKPKYLIPKEGKPHD